MRLKITGKYTTAAICLLAMSAVLITISLLSNPGDITTAAFVFSGMVFAMTGIFILAFSGGAMVDPRLVGILPAQGSLNICQIAKHFGIQGNAYFLPPQITGEASVLQFNPIAEYDGKQGFVKRSSNKNGQAGLVTLPSCDLLIQDLIKRYALVIPDKEEELSILLGETIEDVFKFVPRVSVRWVGSKVSITFHEYPYIDGCMIIALKSPGCCSMSPCPACSLCGVLIAKGRNKVVTLNRCSVSSSKKDVTAVFSILSLPDSNP